MLADGHNIYLQKKENSGVRTLHLEMKARRLIQSDQTPNLIGSESSKF